MRYRMREEWCDCCKGAALAWGVIGGAGGLLTLLLILRPVPYRLLLKPRGALPLPILLLLLLLGCFFTGVAFGVLCYDRRGRLRTRVILPGGLLLLSALLFWLWMLLFFRSLRMLISMLLLLAAVGAAVAAILLLRPKRLLPVLALLPAALGWLYLIWFNLALLIIN